jgi:predicted transcriptional regulator
MSVRTTVRLDEKLMHRVKRYALEHNKTLTAVIEDALREKLASRTDLQKQRFELRTFDGGGLQPGVDLDDNAGTRDVMDGLE